MVSVDTAIEEGNHNDFNAVTVWGAFAGKEGEPLFLLMDAWRERLSLAQLVYQIQQTCRKWKADYLLLEHRTRGRDVHDEIQRLYSAGTWETVLVKPDASKMARMKAIEHFFSGDYARVPTGGRTPDGKLEYIDTWTGGVVYAPAKDWSEMVIDELAAFPYSKHDDFCDSVSQCLGFARKNGVIIRRPEWDAQEYERNLFRRPVGTPYAIRRSQ
jgi:phage terminase large subunit-like protein